MDPRASFSTPDPRPFAAEAERPDFGSSLRAVARHSWLLVLALGAGVPGAYLAWANAPVTYTAQASVWIDAGPRAEEQLPSGVTTPGHAAWIDLLRSRRVLEPVAVEHPLYAARPDAVQALARDLRVRTDPSGNVVSLALSGPDPHRTTEVLNAVVERFVTVAAELKRNRVVEAVAVADERLAVTERALSRAEQDLDRVRASGVRAPSDPDARVVPDLRAPRDLLVARYFDAQVELQGLSNDLTLLESVLDGSAAGPELLQVLESVEAATRSMELRRLLDELVATRVELRTLEARPDPDASTARALETRIATLETVAIPLVVQAIVQELEVRRDELHRTLDAMAEDLRRVPPRVTEERRLVRRVEQLAQRDEEIRAKMEVVRRAAATATPSVRIFGRAVVPVRPSQDRRLPFAAAVLLVCLAAGVAGALALDGLSFRIGEDLLPLVVIVGAGAFAIVVTLRLLAP